MKIYKTLLVKIAIVIIIFKYVSNLKWTNELIEKNIIYKKHF